MKAYSLNTYFFGHFLFSSYVENKKSCFSKMKSILKIEKWTKINVQKWDFKNVLTDEKL
jgi:hypothetical protein